MSIAFFGVVEVGLHDYASRDVGLVSSRSLRVSQQLIHFPNASACKNTFLSS